MKHYKNLIKVIFCLLLCVSQGIAQDSPPAKSNVGNGGVLGTFESESYILKTGDKLELFVTALPDLPSIYEVRVDGNFYHPVVGQVRAAGRTLSDMRSELKAKLGKELRYPDFRLGIQAISKLQVAVLGEASSQGSFDIGVGGTALDALAKAGGLSEKADANSAVILRGTEQIEISLDPVAGQGLTRMQAGDVLYIKPGLQVSVAGEVSEPGPYNVSQGGGTPWNAIIAAGGAKEEAALSRVKLIRPTFPEPLVIDLTPGKEAAIPEEARQLQAGDIVVVPARQAVVLGAVNEPGPTPLVKEVTLLDLLSEKLTAESDIKHVLVVRSEDVQKNRDKQEEYNLNDYLKDGKGDLAAVPIRDGDLVYIPAKNQKGGIFGNFGSVVGILSLARLFF